MSHLVSHLSRERRSDDIRADVRTLQEFSNGTQTTPVVRVVYVTNFEPARASREPPGPSGRTSLRFCDDLRRAI